MKRSFIGTAAIVMITIWASLPTAPAAGSPITVTGTSACAQCEGIAEGHDIALKTANGLNFVLKGKGDDYKTIHKLRTKGETITAALEGPVKPMKNKEGVPYLQVDVSSVRLKSAVGPVTVTGASACAQCEGIAKGHDIALKTASGINFVLKGKGDDYKAVHELRTQGKTITANIVGPIKPMKNDEGKAYLEAAVSRVMVLVPVTLVGTSACAQCEGIANGHDIALKTKSGINIVLKGKGDDYKAVHKLRTQGQSIIATLVGNINPMKNDEGKPYFEAAVASVQVKQ